VDRELADTFDANDSDSDEENDGDDRQRLMRGTPSTSPPAEQVDSEPAAAPVVSQRPQRSNTELPSFVPTITGRVYGGGSGSDGVFANLSAKPESGEKLEEHPPACLPHMAIYLGKE
jgi:hypothetical protein